ncbi:PE-PPE domain-containing protein [Gordonia insulae]|uniref:PE-PPE domain-containing protein n=1 Tax=Gordonia insulae TaxID=2420509 RepID=A0A3G8JK90_9ACTN|nr:PE-PPE domain-containing protein [Gordonia insulae]AZG44909.1 hypothetical protein D7316_01501 [Gordonia insulae]
MTSRFRLSHRFSIVLIAVSSGFAVIAAFCLPGAIGDARAESCGAGAVVIVGGTWDPEGKAMVGVAQRYTGKGARNENVGGPYSGDGAYEIIYADYPMTLWPLGATGYDESVAAGKKSTANEIADYQSRCDGNPVVVAGYSQGARVAGDVLSDIGNSPKVDANREADDAGEYRLVDVNGTPEDFADDVLVKYEGVSGELYADPRMDGTVAGEGIELALIGIIPGLTMSGAREGGFGDVPVTSVCVDGDPICDLPDPLHDPIGAIDGLVGYFNKHNQYPLHMFRDPKLAWWTDHDVECSAEGACVVAYDSAIMVAIREGADAIGLDGDRIPDLLADHLTIRLPDGMALANLQPLVRLVQDRLPSLPNLGYGAYLPDLYVFQAILDGIVNRAPDEIKGGVAALAASAKSILLYPANFVKYWAGQVVGPVVTTGASTMLLADDSVSAGMADEQATYARTLAAVENPPAVGTSGADSAPAESAPAPTTTTPAVDPVVSAEQPSSSGTGDGTPPAYEPPASAEPPAEESPAYDPPAHEPPVQDSQPASSQDTSAPDPGDDGPSGEAAATDTQSSGQGTSADEGGSSEGGSSEGDGGSDDKGTDSGSGPGVTGGGSGGKSKSGTSSSGDSGSDDD